MGNQMDTRVLRQLLDCINFHSILLNKIDVFDFPSHICLDVYFIKQIQIYLN